MKHLKFLITTFVLGLLAVTASAQTRFPGQVIHGNTIVSNGVGAIDAVWTPATQLTNYTLIATQHVATINGTNAIRFTLLQGGTAGQKFFPTVTITNFTASPVTLAFTNTWKRYGTASGFVTNAKTAQIRFEVEGSNVRYSVLEEP